ncbi:DUF6415 family natural product biosynthesis protein [Streptomyces sp. NPDC005805]|uniref:DUF6415 family natural product biosynthesis protein n=1 Tax=Streptomyces sp. NPDC005805 TaxID=3157068 RepID=UPI0033E4E9F7
MQNDTTGPPPPGPAAPEPGSPPAGVAGMRDAARRVLALGGAPPSREDLERLTDTLHGYVRLLVPEVRALIRARPADDPPARVAQVGVDEAWRRLHTAPGFGPDAALRHACRVARSVQALCDHYETLNPPITTGIR